MNFSFKNFLFFMGHYIFHSAKYFNIRIFNNFYLNNKCCKMCKKLSFTFDFRKIEKMSFKFIFTINSIEK